MHLTTLVWHTPLLPEGTPQPTYKIILKTPVDYKYLDLYSKDVVVLRNLVFQELPMIMTSRNQKKYVLKHLLPFEVRIGM